MPLYEYTCKTCDHDFEELVLDPKEKVECPECHGTKVQRQLSVPAAPQVKGGTALPLGGACRSEGPPCGPGCSRF